MPVDSAANNIVYFGVININVDEKTIGSVDVWRDAITKQVFCEEKQLGIDSITDVVGMPKIESDEKWAIITNKLYKGKDMWTLARLKENGIIKIENPDEQIITLNVKNYCIEDDNYSSVLVMDHVNTAIEI